MKGWIILLLTCKLLIANDTYIQALAFYYDENRSNDKQAITLLSTIAEEGSADAAFLIAVAYDQGSVAEKAAQKALFWYEKASQLGDLDAMMIAGWRYYKGEGCDKNLTKAISWFEKASENGDREAEKLLQILQSDGVF